MQKNFCSNFFFIGILKVNDENRRIRIRCCLYLLGRERKASASSLPVGVVKFLTAR